MLIENRVKEIFYLFARILPIYGLEEKTILERRFGIKMEEVVPIILQSLAQNCIDPLDKDRAEGYFDWIASAILYMKGDSDELPETILEDKKGNQLSINSNTPQDLHSPKPKFVIKTRK